MSATEVIEQIKALPPEERQQVEKFIVTMNDAAEAGADMRPGFDQMAREVFDRYDDLFRELAK